MKHIKYIVGAIVLFIGGLFAPIDTPDFGYSANVIDTVNNQGSVTLDGDTLGTEVLSKNVNRQYARICNEGTDIVWLSFATSTNPISALPTEGLRLNSSGVGGTCFEITPDNLYTGAINATTTDGSGIDDIVTFIER